MIQKVGLFTNVDPDDRNALMGKALSAASWIRIFAIVGLVMTIIAGIAFTLLTFGIGFIIAIIFIAIEALIFVYTGKLKQQIEENIIPSLTLPYVFAVFAILGAISSLKNIQTSSVFNAIINILIQAFTIYLWYVLISCIKKADNAHEVQGRNDYSDYQDVDDIKDIDDLV